jgi:hypothetical protein
MHLVISDWRIILGLFVGVAVLLAALRGDVFNINLWKGAVQTKARPKRKRGPRK